MKTKTTDKTRIEIIDVLRGFTLLGIVLVHFAEQYYAGPLCVLPSICHRQ